MVTSTMRPYAGEADLQAAANLINTCEAVDQLDEGTSVSELRQVLDSPLLDKARDLRLWEDNDGKLIGLGYLGIPESGEVIDGSLWFRVHPTARRSDLEMQIVGWGEERMREVSQKRGVRAKLYFYTRAEQAEHIALLERCTFKAERYFFSMRRDLTEPLPEPMFPEGFILRQITDEQDVKAWVETFNQSFTDHWNYQKLTADQRKRLLSDPNYRPELDLIAITPDGTCASLCYCYINPDDNLRSERNEGWIGTLGTRRGFRKRGLGRAMLLAGMHRLKATGIDTARLRVDAQNPNEARRLYESVGFCKVHTRIFYVKNL